MIWLDAHLSPRLARFLTEELGHEAKPIRDIGLRDADDKVIYERAGIENAIFVTKDKDFSDLATRIGPPPHVILLSCGNTTEQRLREIFSAHLNHAVVLIEQHGEALVEITGQ